MSTDTAGPSTDWFDQFIAENRAQGLRDDVKDDPDAPGGKRVDFQVVGGVSSNTAHTISFKSVPDDEAVAVFLMSAVKWTIIDVADRVTAQVRVQRPSNSKNGYLQVDRSVSGIVELKFRGSGVPVSSDEDSQATLKVTSGALIVGEEGLGGALVELAGGSLGAGTFGTVRLVADATVTAISNRQISVDRLCVKGKRTLELSSEGRHMVLSQLVPDDEDVDATLRLTRAAQQQRANSQQEVGIAIEHLRDLTVKAERSLSLDVQKRASELKVSGPTQFNVGANAIVDGVIFTPDEVTPRLGAGPGAILTGVAGTVTISGIKGAHLAGAGDGFLIQDIRSSQRSGAAAGGLCDEAFVSNFRVPPGLRGRSILNHFDDAHHVEPSTAGLPGWNLRYLGSSDKTPVELRHDAELLRKLRELAREKGASGATRTKVGWCAQRLRHATTSGRVESVALAGYRSLGYGERPGPAFATWVALSLIFSGVLAIINSNQVQGCLDFFLLWAERAASPIGAIVGSGSGAESEAWLYLIRAVVAIPLVVAALSTRNYVRVGR